MSPVSAPLPRAAARIHLHLAGLGAACGAGLWSTPGLLAVSSHPGEPTRVAMLPPVSVLILLVTAVVAGLMLLARALARRTSVSGDRSTRRAALDALLPLWGSAALVLPYLPWLPDALPVLTALSGPGAALVWLVVLAQTSWNLVTLGRRQDQISRHADEKRGIVAVVLVGFVGSGLVAARLTGTSLYPAGDEPHYLVIAQSLWRDGDLRIENNHERGDYREYYVGGPLAPHYLTRGTDGEIYSVHPIGLPVLIAPVYAAGGYAGVLIALIAVAAAAGGLAWRWMQKLGYSPGPRSFAWLGVYASAPFLLHSIAVYPEVTAGLAVLVAVTIATTTTEGHRRDGRTADGLARWTVAGVACAALPWLSTKYAPMAAMVVAVALERIWFRHGARPLGARVRTSAALLTPVAIAMAAWFAFFSIHWGSFSPSSPYGGQPGTSLGYLRAGGLGLAFDQEYGVVPYAPVFVLAGIGLVGMVRSGGRTRQLALELLTIVAALVLTVGAFHIWWGGSSPPGRPVVSILLLLTAPIAWLRSESQARPAIAAAQTLLLIVGIGMTALLVVAREGLLINNDRDGTSNLLEYLSQTWTLTQAVPSFIVQSPAVALRGLAVWLALGCGVGLTLRRLSSSRPDANTARLAPGRSALYASAAAGLVLVTASLLVPVAQGTGRSAGVDAPMRARIDLLERFDATRLPTAVVYHPLRVVQPRALLPHFSFVVAPPDPDAEPDEREPLLYGRRLVLPAGRYALELTIRSPRQERVEGELAVKLGRRDAPFVRWDVSMGASDLWSRELELGTDVSYAGFRASSSLEDAEPVLRLRPLHIVDASMRARHPLVIGAVQYAQAAVFFLDDNFFAEPSGFWIRRGRTARVLVTRSSTQAPPAGVNVRTHCGPVANVLRIASGRQAETLALEAEEARDFHFPAESGRVDLRLSADDGFVPAQVDPSSQDLRDLGCWVEVTGWTE